MEGQPSQPCRRKGPIRARDGLGPSALKASFCTVRSPFPAVDLTTAAQWEMAGTTCPVSGSLPFPTSFAAGKLRSSCVWGLLRRDSCAPT